MIKMYEINHIKIINLCIYLFKLEQNNAIYNQ